MKVVIERRRNILDDFFKIEEVFLQHEKFDGRMTPTLRRLKFERGDSASALTFNISTKRVVLVNQFRFPTFAKGPGWTTEAVAGMIDSNETPENAIRREILEETGYRTSRLEHISTFYVSPGGSSERIILYFAEVDNSQKVGVGGGLNSEGEDIQVIELSLEEVLKQIQIGTIIDAKTIVGVFWLRNRLVARPIETGSTPLKDPEN
jgi:nudix-type nucleoside diphosphatase (YffH/AdpP family)